MKNVSNPRIFSFEAGLAGPISVWRYRKFIAWSKGNVRCRPLQVRSVVAQPIRSTETQSCRHLSEASTCGSVHSFGSIPSRPSRSKDECLYREAGVRISMDHRGPCGESPSVHRQGDRWERAVPRLRSPYGEDSNRGLGSLNGVIGLLKGRVRAGSYKRKELRVSKKDYRSTDFGKDEATAVRRRVAGRLPAAYRAAL